MPEEPGQTVGTEFGDVPLAAIDLGPTGADATPDGTETQRPADATPDAAPIKVGDADYTLKEIQDAIDRANNYREMTTSADARYKEAAELREQFNSDPEVRRLKFLLDQIKSNPQALAEFNAVSAGLDGQAGATDTRAMWEIQQLKERLEATEHARDAQSGKETIDEFLAMQNKVAEKMGQPGWTRETPEFKQFFERFDSEVAPDGPFGADLNAYFWSSQGPQLLEAVAAGATKQGAQTAAETLAAARQMAANEVPAKGHGEPRSYEPDMSTDDLEPEVQAALRDSSILPGIG